MSAASPQGFLFKKGAVVQLWKRRFFVLDGDSLKYYKSQEAASSGACKGSIPMADARILILDADDYGKDFAFGITPRLSKRTFVLAANSEEERRRWVSFLSTQGVSHQSLAASAAEVSQSQSLQSGNAFSGAEAGQIGTKVDPRSIREGFLTKQGEVVKNWKRRYFALFAHTLNYYKHKGDVVPAGEVPLGAGVVVAAEPAVDASKQFCFSVSPLTKGTSRRYFLVADSEAERNAWISSISTISSLRTTELMEQLNNLQRKESDWPDDSDSEDETVFDGDEAELSVVDATAKPSLGRPLSSALQSTATALTVREGFLHKQGAGFSKAWRKRYFVLQSTPERRVLIYFKEAESDNPTGRITLEPGATVEATDTDKPFSFTLTPARAVKGRTYVMHASSDRVRQSWLRSLQTAIQGHAACQRLIADPAHMGVSREPTRMGQPSMKGVTSFSGFTSVGSEQKRPDQQLLTLNKSRQAQWKVDPMSLREGDLNKLAGGKGSKWEIRYFVLIGDALNYYSKKSDAASRGKFKSVPLRGATVAAVPFETYSSSLQNSSHHYLFSVTPSNSQRSFVLGTDTQEDFDLWVTALQMQISSFQMQSVRGDSIKEGFLHRFSSGAWSQGYFVLRSTEALLLQFKGQEDASSSGAVPSDKLVLTDANIELMPNDRYQREFTFVIEDHSQTDGSTPKWICSAGSRADMDEWVDAVVSAEADLQARRSVWAGGALSRYEEEEEPTFFRRDPVNYATGTDNIDYDSDFGEFGGA